jgi:hypothetical protein
MYGGSVGIAPPLLNSALGNNTLYRNRRENLKTYDMLSTYGCKAAVLITALILLLNLNSTNINREPG